MGGGLATISHAMRGVDPFDRSADRATVEAELAGLRWCRAWLDGRQTVVARLGELCSLPEDVLIETGRHSQRDADRIVERAGTVRVVPRLGAALAAGEISGEHVDVFSRGLKSVAPEQRAALVEHLDALVDVAAGLAVDEVDQRVRAEVRAVH